MDYSNRYKQFNKGVKLPEIYVPEDRGIESCCCKFLVWGSPEGIPHKKMFTSAWKQDVDSVRFYLVKGSQEYEIAEQTPVLDTAARYCTVDWSFILSEYGSGCYTLKIDYDVSGITGTQVWGQYDLIHYDLYRVRNYVMIRTVLNSSQTIEGINFRGSNVVDCIAFKGFFGRANPNTQVENIIYSNRTSTKVVRENLYEYELETDPLLECLTMPLLDLHFLSENEMYISDFNPMNHHQYLSKSVIFEVPEKPEYVGNLAIIKAKFGDKKKDKRSRYGY